MQKQINNIGINKSVLRETFLKYRKIFIYAFWFSFAINLLSLGASIYSLQVYDRVLTSGSIETLFMLTLIVVASIIFLGFFGIVRSYIFFQITKNLDDDLSNKILENSIAVYSGQKNNAVSPTQLLRDFGVVKNFVSSSIMHTIFDAPWSIIFIIAIFFVHYINGIVVLVSALVLLFLAYINDYTIKEDIKKANEASVKSLNYIEFSSRNAEVIEAMGMKGNLIRHWQNIEEPAKDLQQKVNEKSTLISSITKIIRMTIQVLMMGIGAYLVINRKMSSGGIIASSILAGKALAPFDASVSIWKSYVSAKKSYDRIDKFLEFSDNAEVLEDTLLPEPEGGLSIEKLFFGIGQKAILKGLSFEIKKGEIIGIIGPSGAGKTTLAKLLVGIYKPNSGNVRLDNAEIFRWNKEHLGRFIGYMPQDIELFAGNIKTNIAKMNESPNNEKVLEAAKIVGANEFILRLEKGYETEVGAGGSHLSSGQAQRIGLARAFYDNPKLIILDEPNAHLDIQGEQAFAKAIEYAKLHTITMVIIAHRSSVLANVDKIMVLQDGLIKIFDDRDKVIEQLRGGN